MILFVVNIFQIIYRKSDYGNCRELISCFECRILFKKKLICKGQVRVETNTYEAGGEYNED